jgi:A/G-specific adenine glycosylase
MKLVSGKHPGDLNQALMELGATICAPDAPRCNACPLKRECLSRACSPLIISSRRARPINVTECFWPLAVVRHRGKILLRLRVNTELLPGLWELPGSEINRRTKAASALRRQLRDLPITCVTTQPIGEVRHTITYRRIRAPIYLFDCPAHLDLPASRWRWVMPRGAGRYPVSSMTKKALAVLAAHETRPA